MNKVLLLFIPLFFLACSKDSEEKEDSALRKSLKAQQWFATDTLRYEAIMEPGGTAGIMYDVRNHTLVFNESTFTWDIEITCVVNDEKTEDSITTTGLYQIIGSSVELFDDKLILNASKLYGQLKPDDQFLLSRSAYGEGSLYGLLFEKED